MHFSSFDHVVSVNISLLGRVCVFAARAAASRTTTTRRFASATTANGALVLFDARGLVDGR